MSAPVAYLLTWTCYGTWLHGDERGSIDDFHNRFSWPVVAPDPLYLDLSKAKLLHPPVKLDAGMRRVAQDTITAHAALRAWNLTLSTYAPTTFMWSVIPTRQIPAGPSASSKPGQPGASARPA